MLTSSPPIETMLDSYPVVYQLMTTWLNSQKAHMDVLGILADIRQFNEDASPITSMLANALDPVRAKMYDDWYAAATTLPTVAAPYNSFELIMQHVISYQWQVQYMLDHFDPVLTDNQRVMLDVAKDTFAKAKEDAFRYFSYELKHTRTMYQVNYSDLFREVDLLLQKNPFNKPL